MYAPCGFIKKPVCAYAWSIEADTQGAWCWQHNGVLLRSDDGPATGSATKPGLATASRRSKAQ